VTPAEQQVPEQVADRVTFRPLEVAVRPYPGGVAQGEQDRRDGVGDGRAVHAENAVAVDLYPPNGEDVAEIGRIDDVDLQEQDVGRIGYRVHPALLAFLGRVFGGIAGLPLVGDDVQPTVVGEGVGDE